MHKSTEHTLMYREAAQAAETVERQLAFNSDAIETLVSRLKERPTRAVITCARGSSDHAATFAKYLIETRLGILTSSAAPSVSSVYFTQQNLQDCVLLVISQSGKSPDLLATAEAARKAGAIVVAMVNVQDSPLAQMADHCIALQAGPELSVAATKSYIAALAAIVHLVAQWSGDFTLQSSLRSAPALLRAAWHLDWSPAIAHLQHAEHLFVMGRGLGLGIALEAALKCKETSALHAEGFSTAEVQHGPQALLGANFPALILAQDDETHAGIKQVAQSLIHRGVPVILAGAEVDGALLLPVIPCHPVIQPMLLALCFYKLVNCLSVTRGLNPDQPIHLRKVTETV